MGIIKSPELARTQVVAASPLISAPTTAVPSYAWRSAPLLSTAAPLTIWQNRTPYTFLTNAALTSCDDWLTVIPIYQPPISLRPAALGENAP
mgnify:FL=1